MKTFASTRILLGLAVALFGRLGVQADCGELVINSLDRGWYDVNGHHDPGNLNYFVGDGGNVGSSGVPVRNFFVFDIPYFTQQVVSASLRVNTFGITSTTGTETYQLRHVGTPITTLRAGGNLTTNIYSDLGDGTIYGSRVFSTTESYQVITIPLNSAFIAALSSATGNLLALGGEVTSLDGTLFNDEYLFGYSSIDLSSVQLVLTLANSSPLIITSQPQSQSVPAAANVSFIAQACGTPPLFYQWQHEGTNLAGADGPSLELFNVSSNDAGGYLVIVTNSSASVTSVVATLTVNYTPPAVSAYLASGRNPSKVGFDVTFCASASGGPYPQLQWRFNGTNLPNETNMCLLLPNAQTNQSGFYTVVASNIVGVVTSAVVTLTVIEPAPVFVYFSYPQPPVAVGSYAYLCSEIGIASPYTLQWRFNEVNLPGQTNACLYLPYVFTTNAGQYTLVATNFSGAYTSPPVELTVYFAPPVFYGTYFVLGSPSALAENDVSFCGNLSGSPPISYRWRFNGVPMLGQTNACLTLFQISTNQAGNYTLVASNIAGVATSSVVTLTVQYQPPIFATQPYDQTVIEGSTVRIPGFASAGPPASHVLQFNSTNLGVPFSYLYGQGGFTLLEVTPADAGSYRIIASNSLGAATSQVATLTVTPAGPLDRWTQRNPLPQSQPLLSVAYGGSQFVAVGERGTILSSPDGTNWTVQSRRVDLPLRGVAYGAGVFVAVGDGGTILSSSDGTNWAYRYSYPSAYFNAVTYGSGRFVAVASGPAQTFIFSSIDGVTWEKDAVENVRAELGVTFGNGTFVAVGSSEVITSTDGLNWRVALTFLPAELESVSYLDGKFVAVGDDGYLLVSFDGTTWDSRSSGTTRRLLGATYGNGQYIAVGVRGTMLTSTHGLTWSPVTSGTPDRLEAVTYANGLFVAVGENGTTITSTNGTNWTKQNYGTTRDLDGMALANGTIVIVGKAGSIMTSTDGTHYTAQNAALTNDLHGVAWGNGLWVAVGEPGIIITSSNAIQWTARITDTTNSLKDATYANGRWIVVGTQGTILTSTDGINWSTQTTIPSFDLNDVAYGNGLYLVVGDGAGNSNGSLFTSTNGLAWVQSYVNFSKNLRGITFVNGIFLIAANDGLVLTGTPGPFTNTLNWSANFLGAGNLRAVNWARGLWTVVGNFGTIFTSTNAQYWVRRPTRTVENLHQVTYLDGKLITIGNRGTVLQSGRFIAELEQPDFDPQLGFTVGFKGVLGQPYQFQASSNLVHWTPLSTFTNLTEKSVHTDANALLYPRRFYRMIEP